MRNVHHVHFRICMHIELNGLVCHSHSTELCLSAWLKYESIFVNRWPAPESWLGRFVMSLLRKSKVNAQFKQLSDIWLLKLQLF